MANTYQLFNFAFLLIYYMEGVLSVKSVALRRNCNAFLHCNFEDSGAFDNQNPLDLRRIILRSLHVA